MAMANNLLGGFGAGFNSGQSAANDIADARRRNQLSSLASQAYSTPEGQRNSLLGQMAAIDPNSAQAQGDAFESEDARRVKKFENMARLLTSAPEQYREGIYQRMRPSFDGMGAADIPDHYTPEMGQMAEKFLAARSGAGGTPAQQQYAEWLLNQVPEGQRDQTLGVLAGYKARPSSAGIQYKTIKGADGREYTVAFDPQEVGAQTIGGGPSFGSMGGGTPQPYPQGGGDQFAFLDNAGATVTSGQRSPEDNTRVGGVQNSYHLTGQARDILPPQNPQQAAMIRQEAAARGLEVIDEGDHWHLEPRGSARQPAQGNPFASRTPEEQAALTEQAKTGVQLANLPQELALRSAAAIEQARGSEGAKAGIERESAARTKAPQLLNVDRGLSRIASAMQALDGGMVNTGPVDQFAIRFTPEGQELEAAVGSIKNDMLALTRVPGVGSQSDLEQRIADLKYPAIGNHPEVNRRNLMQLNAFLRDLDEAIGGGVTSTRQPEQAGVQRARNPQTGEVLELRNGQWVPAQ